MSKKTAVEFLIEQFDLHYNGENDLSYSEFIEKAKQMEKEQSKNAYYAGLEGYIVKDGGFEGYYFETYGSNNN